MLLRYFEHSVCPIFVFELSTYLFLPWYFTKDVTIDDKIVRQWSVKKFQWQPGFKQFAL